MEMGIIRSFSRDKRIYGDLDPAEYFYKVIKGAVRSYKILIDGRRQIGGFYLPGAIFGLQLGDVHDFSTEAIVPSKILIVKRSKIVALAAAEPEVAQALWAITARELKNAQDHFLLLGKTASERVTSFLLEMAEHDPLRDEFELPMSRQDIADYLGLTIETVSRMLSRLAKQSSIRLTSRKHIVLRNRVSLERSLA